MYLYTAHMHAVPGDEEDLYQQFENYSRDGLLEGALQDAGRTPLQAAVAGARAFRRVACAFRRVARAFTRAAACFKTFVSHAPSTFEQALT
jgi:hypothetical protein